MTNCGPLSRLTFVLRTKQFFEKRFKTHEIKTVEKEMQMALLEICKGYSKAKWSKNSAFEVNHEKTKK